MVTKVILANLSYNCLLKYYKLKNMSCYTATLNLLPFREYPESFWSEFYIENVSLDDEQPIEIFDSGKYKLLVKTDKDGRIETVIYQSNLQGTFDTFKDEAIREIIKSLNRLEIAFIAPVNFLKLHSPSRKTKYENNLNIEVLNSDKSQEALPEEVRAYAVGGINVPKTLPTASLKEINDVLAITKDNVDEYIERFLSIKELSTDPVLHLVALCSLYEFIEYTRKDIVGHFKVVNKLSSYYNFEEAFTSTRNLVAHGYVDRKKTVEVLQELLGQSNKSKIYEFDRYNESHINLINDVINESQVIIIQYLKKLIEISK